MAKDGRQSLEELVLLLVGWLGWARSQLQDLMMIVGQCCDRNISFNLLN